MDRTKTKQTLLLDKNGHILHSCGVLFAVQDLQTKSLLSYFPFLDSIFYVLFDMPAENFPMHFPRVEASTNFLPGVYDFTFEKVTLKEKEYLRWTIYDNTKAYELQRREQQLHHEQYV